MISGGLVVHTAGDPGDEARTKSVVAILRDGVTISNSWDLQVNKKRERKKKKEQRRRVKPRRKRTRNRAPRRLRRSSEQQTRGLGRARVWTEVGAWGPVASAPGREGRGDCRGAP